ncbi:MAG: large subunit ribosomal protein L28, partial [Planctomycetota bacterium]
PGGILWYSDSVISLLYLSIILVRQIICIMAKSCCINGKSSLVGGRYSNRVRATEFNPTGSVRRKANLQTKNYYIPEIDQTIKVTISVQGMKTVNKNGAYKAFKKAGVIK